MSAEFEQWLMGIVEMFLAVMGIGAILALLVAACVFVWIWRDSRKAKR